MARDNYFSAIKGLAIIAVLFIHTPFEFNNELGNIFLRQPFTYAVALFFFLSGYFVKKESLDKTGIKRILFPYLIWSFCFFLYSTIKGSYSLNTKRVFDVLFFGGAFFPLYFLSVMIQLKLLTPLIFKLHRKNRVNKILLFSITPVYLCILYFIQHATGKQPWIYAQIFPAWFLLYYMGISMREREGRVNIHSLNLVSLLIAGLTLMLLESLFIYEVWEIPFFAASQIKFSSFLYTVCIILVLLKSYTPLYSRNFLAKIGEVSFGIYLLHIPVKKVLGVIFNIITLPDILNPLFIIMEVIITILCCYYIIIVASKILTRNQLRILGLE